MAGSILRSPVPLTVAAGCSGLRGGISGARPGAHAVACEPDPPLALRVVGPFLGPLSGLDHVWLVGLRGLEPRTSSLSGMFQRPAPPAAIQVGGPVGLSASDREFPALTGRSGTQRARRLRSRLAVGTPLPPAACRGWPASGPGRLPPGPWFLIGGVQRLRRSRGGPEDAFCEAV
jgi:hypothetical protein